MNSNNTVHFPDESPQAKAIRARLAAGDQAFVLDTGNGFTVADPAGASDTDAFFQVSGVETRSAAVLSSWPVVPYNPAPDPNRHVTIFNQVGVIHAPQAVPASESARKTLVSSSHPGEYGSVRLRFTVQVGPHAGIGETLSNWNLCWLQVGESWRGRVLAYLNYYPAKQWLRLTTNFGHPGSGALHRDVRRVVLTEGESYVVDFEYVAGFYAQASVSTPTGETLATVRESRQVASSIVIDGDWRLAFGHERAEKDTKLEPGWGYQWLNVQLSATASARGTHG